MTEKTAPETLPEIAERKAASPKAATYRALTGFSYPRPGGAVEVEYATDHGAKKVLSREIHVEAGATKLSLPDATVAALLSAGAIAKE